LYCSTGLKVRYSTLGLTPPSPSLVPVARAQLEDQVRVLKTQLDVLTRRLGVPLASASRTAEDL
jgi:hypothetical protein